MVQITLIEKWPFKREKTLAEEVVVDDYTYALLTRTGRRLAVQVNGAVKDMLENKECRLELTFKMGDPDKEFLAYIHSERELKEFNMHLNASPERDYIRLHKVGVNTCSHVLG